LTKEVNLDNIRLIQFISYVSKNTDFIGFLFFNLAGFNSRQPDKKNIRGLFDRGYFLSGCRAAAKPVCRRGASAPSIPGSPT